MQRAVGRNEEGGTDRLAFSARTFCRGIIIRLFQNLNNGVRPSFAVEGDGTIISSLFSYPPD